MILIIYSPGGCFDRGTRKSQERQIYLENRNMTYQQGEDIKSPNTNFGEVSRADCDSI